MGIVSQWKIVGWLMMLVGVKALITGSVGYKIYIEAEGGVARLIGGLLVFTGVMLAFPRKK